jgi:hypothetical protein
VEQDRPAGAHGVGHAGDGVIGDGHDDQIDVLSGLGRVIGSADDSSALPALPIEGDPERRTGPTRTDDAEVHGL